MAKDWIEDDSLSSEEKLARFESLPEVAVTGPRRLPGGARIATPSFQSLPASRESLDLSSRVPQAVSSGTARFPAQTA